ncbi:MAG: DUF3617 family protein [Burkholderiaceae bacterium]
MNRTVLLTATLALALVAAPVANAAGKPRLLPGLWESKMSGDMMNQMDAQMQALEAQIAKMPQAQQQQMRAMIAGQLKKVTQGHQVCITPKMAAEGPEKSMDKREGCEQTFKWESDKRGVFTMRCTDGTRGDGEMTIADPKHWVTNMTVGQGDKQQKMRIEGRWLANDCGSVKPVRN